MSVLMVVIVVTDVIILNCPALGSDETAVMINSVIASSHVSSDLRRENE